MSLKSVLNVGSIFNEAEESQKFLDGELTLKQMQDDYEKYSTSNHVALKDLYDAPDGFKASQDHLFTTVLPQLKLLNELSTLVHAFPHYSIPSVVALTDSIKERVNYTLNNIQNFGQVGSIVATDPELAAMVNNKQRMQPYKYVAGKDEDEEKQDNEEEPSEDVEEPSEDVEDDGIVVEESSSSDEEKSAKKKKTQKIARPVHVDSEKKKIRKRVKKTTKKRSKNQSGSI
jgi:hypothetical protein